MQRRQKGDKRNRLDKHEEQEIAYRNVCRRATDGYLRKSRLYRKTARRQAERWLNDHAHRED